MWPSGVFSEATDWESDIYWMLPYESVSINKQERFIHKTQGAGVCMSEVSGTKWWKLLTVDLRTFWNAVLNHDTVLDTFDTFVWIWCKDVVIKQLWCQIPCEQAPSDSGDETWRNPCRTMIRKWQQVWIEEEEKRATGAFCNKLFNRSETSLGKKNQQKNPMVSPKCVTKSE